MFLLPAGHFLPPAEKETEAKATEKVECVLWKAALHMVWKRLQSDDCGSLKIKKLI